MSLNKFDVSGDYGIGWTSNTEREFCFDLEDYDKIKNYTWREIVSGSGYHELVTTDNQSGNNIRMHWLILGKYYDHKDRNSFNNRKENLRPATIEQNARNQSIKRTNKSGVIGVSWDSKANKWRAQINYNKKHIHLGRFNTKEEAIIARLKAEKEYYQDFAPQQDLYVQYDI